MDSETSGKPNWDDDLLPSAKATTINKARMGTYGSPVPNYKAFAKILEVIFGHDVSPQQAVMVMIGVKMMREIQSDYPGYPDNLDDICGFSNVLYLVKEDARDSSEPS